MGEKETCDINGNDLSLKFEFEEKYAHHIPLCRDLICKSFEIWTDMYKGFDDFYKACLVVEHGRDQRNTPENPVPTKAAMGFPKGNPRLLFDEIVFDSLDKKQDGKKLEQREKYATLGLVPHICHEIGHYYQELKRFPMPEFESIAKKYNFDIIVFISLDKKYDGMPDESEEVRIARKVCSFIDGLFVETTNQARTSHVLSKYKETQYFGELKETVEYVANLLPGMSLPVLINLYTVRWPYALGFVLAHEKKKILLDITEGKFGSLYNLLEGKFSEGLANNKQQDLAEIISGINEKLYKMIDFEEGSKGKEEEYFDLLFPLFKRLYSVSKK